MTTPATFLTPVLTTLARGETSPTTLYATETILQLQSGTGALLPQPVGGANTFLLLLGAATLTPYAPTGPYEIVLVTARVGDTLTVTRGQGATTARDWPVGTVISNAVIAGSLPSSETQPTPAVFNVCAYGATGTGATDDGPAFRACAAAMLAAVQAGASAVTMYVPSGVYQCSVAPHPISASVNVICALPTNSSLIGDSDSIIRLAPNQPNQSWMISNYTIINYSGYSYTDTDFTVRNITFDGNAANQSGIDAQHGLIFVGCQNVRVMQCKFTNIYGSTAGSNGPHGTNGEGFMTDVKWSSGVSYSGCVAFTTGGASTSTGFSANGSTSVSYYGCSSYGHAHSMGFTNWKCAGVTYSGCFAGLVGVDGFHSEYGDGVVYQGCRSGGASSAIAGNPYTASQSLGNTQAGIHLYEAVAGVVAQCVSQGNGSYGLLVDSAQGPVTVTGGMFTNNSAYGIRLGDAASVTNTTISVRPVLTGNTSGAIWYNGALTVMAGANATPTPTVPATTVALTNPFPFDATVYLSGGTVTGVALDSVTTGTTSPGMYRVHAGGTITLTYSVAPTWVWFAS